MYEEIFYDKQNGEFYDKINERDFVIRKTPNVYSSAYITSNKKTIFLYRIVYYKIHNTEIPQNISIKFIDGDENNFKINNIVFYEKWEGLCEECNTNT